MRGRLNAGIRALVEEGAAKQTRFHCNIQEQQSSVTCWLNPKLHINTIHYLDTEQSRRILSTAKKVSHITTNSQSSIWDPQPIFLSP
jgi:hypothetical protein